jgi:hypothetical protein
METFYRKTDLKLPRHHSKHRVGRVLRFFSSRRNWKLGTVGTGEGHTRWRERGWESPNSDEGTSTVVPYSLCIRTLCTVQKIYEFDPGLKCGFWNVRESSKLNIPGTYLVIQKRNYPLTGTAGVENQMTVSLGSARDELLHKLPRAGPQVFLKFCQTLGAKKKNGMNENHQGFTI